MSLATRSAYKLVVSVVAIAIMAGASVGFAPKSQAQQWQRAYAPRQRAEVHHQHAVVQRMSRHQRRCFVRVTHQHCFIDQYGRRHCRTHQRLRRICWG